MTLDEAIEILEHQIRLTSPNLEPDLITADKLGIEALKQIKINRGKAWVPPEMRLPGETKD